MSAEVLVTTQRSDPFREPHPRGVDTVRPETPAAFGVRSPRSLIPLANCLQPVRERLQLPVLACRNNLAAADGTVELFRSYAKHRIPLACTTRQRPTGPLRQ